MVLDAEYREGLKAKSASSEFIANKNSVEQIAENMGADRLFYQDLEDLVESIRFESTGPQEFAASAHHYLSEVSILISSQIIQVSA